MKKLIIAVLLVLSLQSVAQNDLFVRNDTAFAVRDGDTVVLAFNVSDDFGWREKIVIQRKFQRLSQQLPSVSVLNNNVTSTSATLTNVNDLSFSGKAGKIYRVELIADYQTAATTTGCIVGLATNGSGNVRGFIKGSVSASAVATELSIPLRAFSGAGSSLTTTGVSGINTPHSIHIVAVIRCTADGVFGVRFGSEVEGSQAQLNAGSVLIVQEL